MALIKRDRENFWMLNWLDEYMTKDLYVEDVSKTYSIKKR